jgi:hypothetical protein
VILRALAPNETMQEMESKAAQHLDCDRAYPGVILHH